MVQFEKTDAENTGAPDLRSPNRTEGYRSMVSLMSQGMALGPDINQFIDELKKQLDVAQPIMGGTTIEIIRLKEPQGSFAFIANKAAIILMFESQLGPDLPNHQPKSIYTQRAYQSLKKERSDAYLVEPIIVSPQDYRRAATWAQFIIRHLAVEVNPDFQRTFEGLTRTIRSENYTVDFDLASARAVEDQYSPHELRPRSTIGLTLRCSDRSNQSNVTNNGFNDLEGSDIVFSAIGYVDFIEQPRATPDNKPKFWPEVVMTDITAPIPFKGVEILAFALWASAFSTEHRWRNQFSSFGTKEPNLGHLLNPTIFQMEKQARVQNQAELNAMVDNWINPALISVSVVEGRARLPALINYVDPTGTRGLDQIKSFFGQSVPLNGAAAFSHFINFVGTIGQTGGQLQDSRNVDFLQLMATEGSQNELSTRLLHRVPNNPGFRAEVIAEKTRTFRSLYEEHIVMFSAELTDWLALAVRQLNIRGASSGVVSYDSSWFANQLTHRSTGTSAFSAGGPSYTPASPMLYYGK